MKPAGYKDLYFIEDNELDINTIIQTYKPKPPVESETYSIHWLAIDGVQPDIPENPSKNKKEIIEAGDTGEEKEGEDQEIQVGIKHVLSRELQLYYEKVTKALMGNNESLSAAALSSLSSDPVLHQLLPYLCQFISKQLIDNLKNLRVLMMIMKMVYALLVNPKIHLDHYLHQIIPVVLTCLVGKKLCAVPTENHWELRDLAAQIIGYICNRWGREYTNLQPRIVKTLVKSFLDLKKPLTTHYGSIVGLTKLGPNTRQIIILPNLPAYFKHLLPALSDTENLLKRSEALMVFRALLTACGLYMYDSAVFYGETEKILMDQMEKVNSISPDIIGVKVDELKQFEVNELLPMTKQYSILYDLFGEDIFTYIPRRQGDPGAEIFL